MQPVKTRGTKRKVSEMYPVKKWLSTQEACSYLNVSPGTFKVLVIEKGLTVSAIKGRMYYYKVAELDMLFEENILIKKIS